MFIYWHLSLLRRFMSSLRSYVYVDLCRPYVYLIPINVDAQMFITVGVLLYNGPIDTFSLVTKNYAHFLNCEKYNTCIIKYCKSFVLGHEFSFQSKNNGIWKLIPSLFFGLCVGRRLRWYRHNWFFGPSLFHMKVKRVSSSALLPLLTGDNSW